MIKINQIFIVQTHFKHTQKKPRSTVSIETSRVSVVQTCVYVVVGEHIYFGPCAAVKRDMCHICINKMKTDKISV